MAASGFVEYEAGASESEGSEEKHDTSLLELEKTFMATGGYDPDGGFVVDQLSEGEGDSPKKVRKVRNPFEKHILRLLTMAGVTDLDGETETLIMLYARRHLQLKRKPPPPKRKKTLKKRTRAISSSSEED